MDRRLAAFPRFRPSAIASAIETGEALGSLSTTQYGDEKWIQDHWLGHLYSDVQLIPGRWHARGDEWGFAPEHVEDLESILRIPEWAVLDSYWGQRATIVLDETRDWRRARFESLFPHQDHDHCAVCWEKIGNQGQAEGYFNAPDNWACEACFRNFIEPRSLAFIPLPDPGARG